jgi:DNA-binding NarL/FixJ family response regulator
MNDVVSIVDAIVEHLARIMGKSVLWRATPVEFGQPLSELTRKEWLVLKSLRSADAEKQIAGRMGLSTHTFHVHVKKIYRKLEVRSRLHLLEMCEQIENCQIALGLRGEQPATFVVRPSMELAEAI